MARHTTKHPHRTAPRRVVHTIRTSNRYLKLFLIGLLIFVLGAVSAYRFLQRIPVNDLNRDLRPNQLSLEASISPSVEPNGALFITPQPTAKPIVIAPKPSVSPTQTSQTGSYEVKKGDSLWKIAQEVYGDGHQWVRIYSENKQEIGKNPGILYAGQKLTLPAKLASSTESGVKSQTSR